MSSGHLTQESTSARRELRYDVRSPGRSTGKLSQSHSVPPERRAVGNQHPHEQSARSAQGYRKGLRVGKVQDQRTSDTGFVLACSLAVSKREGCTSRCPRCRPFSGPGRGCGRDRLFTKCKRGRPTSLVLVLVARQSSTRNSLG